MPANTFQTATRFDALLAYVNGPARAGIEYLDANDWKVTTKKTPDKATGYSAFASYIFIPQWSVFGRYDALTPSQDLAPSERYTLANVGISYEPVKTVDLALVYKHESVNHAPVGGYTDFTTVLAPLGGSAAYDEVGLFSQFKF